MPKYSISVSERSLDITGKLELIEKLALKFYIMVHGYYHPGYVSFHLNRGRCGLIQENNLRIGHY